MTWVDVIIGWRRVHPCRAARDGRDRRRGTTGDRTSRGIGASSSCGICRGTAESASLLAKRVRPAPPNPVVLVVSDLRAVLEGAATRAGISVLPRYIAEPALKSGRVVQLHEPEAAPLNTLYLT
ncbi:LysR substrate-binding domain-containing protein [Nonomuraea ceibae]|uniref:LysR substrate-binding domain-containing protein n=1 Tax=Nonomuraea ceibae TaxID=1935170 RepID=UPI001FEC6538|nr:LysR substrate-binding domain-containing protein [Nonomuraea ceibae]